MKIRLLPKNEVAELLSMKVAIELMAQAFRELSSGNVTVPPRVQISNANGTLLYKPALMNSQNAFLLKAVSVFPGNRNHHLAVTTGLAILNDGRTGYPVALMDAEYLTGLRTGAATGLASQLLANPNCETVGLFGTGGQAVFQLRALSEVHPLRRMFVFSRTWANAATFCKDHASSVPFELIPASSRDELKRCSVIATATTSERPLFTWSEISPGTHISGVGSFKPDMVEIDDSIVTQSQVFVDERESAMREAGDLIVPMTAGKLPPDFRPAELGEVLLGHRSGREHHHQVTFFKSVGNAAQDIVCAVEIYRRAVEEDRGTIIEL